MGPRLSRGWVRPTKLLPREVVVPWPSLRTASVSLRLNLDPSKLRLEIPSRPSKRLSVMSRTFKSQIGEAEEIAALNLAKFRKAQQDLEENEERAKMAGAALQVAMQDVKIFTSKFEVIFSSNQ